MPSQVDKAIVAAIVQHGRGTYNEQDLRRLVDYDNINNLMPKGFRASFLKSVDWPSAWGVFYGLSPAQISQDRYADLVAQNLTEEAKKKIWTQLVELYAIGAPSPIPASEIPNFRRPSWMTGGDVDIVMEIFRSALNRRAQSGAASTGATPAAPASTGQNIRINLPDSPPRFNPSQRQLDASETMEITAMTPFELMSWFRDNGMYGAVVDMSRMIDNANDSSTATGFENEPNKVVLASATYVYNLMFNIVGASHFKMWVETLATQSLIPVDVRLFDASTQLHAYRDVENFNMRARYREAGPAVQFSFVRLAHHYNPGSAPKEVITAAFKDGLYLPVGGFDLRAYEAQVRRANGATSESTLEPQYNGLMPVLNQSRSFAVGYDVFLFEVVFPMGPELRGITRRFSSDNVATEIWGLMGRFSVIASRLLQKIRQMDDASLYHNISNDLKLRIDGYFNSYAQAMYGSNRGGSSQSSTEATTQEATTQEATTQEGATQEGATGNEPEGYDTLLTAAQRVEIKGYLRRYAYVLSQTDISRPSQRALIQNAADAATQIQLLGLRFEGIAGLEEMTSRGWWLRGLFAPNSSLAQQFRGYDSRVLVSVNFTATSSAGARTFRANKALAISRMLSPRNGERAWLPSEAENFYAFREPRRRGGSAALLVALPIPSDLTSTLQEDGFEVMYRKWMNYAREMATKARAIGHYMAEQIVINADSQETRAAAAATRATAPAAPAASQADDGRSWTHTYDNKTLVLTGSHVPELQGVRDGFYLLGMQYATPQRLFNSGPLPVVTRGPQEAASKSYIFYFVTLNKHLGRGQVRLQFLQCNFGELPGTAMMEYDVFRPNDGGLTGLGVLEQAMRETGRLDDPQKLKMFSLNSEGIDKVINGIGPIPFVPERATANLAFDFNMIERLKMEDGGKLLKSLIKVRTQGSQEEDTAAGVVLSEDQIKSIGTAEFKRGFGIEIEGAFDEMFKTEAARKLTAKGIKTKPTHYHGSAPEGYFKLEDDSSVQGNHPFEMVSPILKGTDGLEKLQKMLFYLTEFGARRNITAGTHVHFSWKDFAPGQQGFQQRKQLIVNFLVLQPFLLATQNISSRGRYYAKQLGVKEHAKNTRIIGKQTGREWIAALEEQALRAVQYNGNEAIEQRRQEVQAALATIRAESAKDFVVSERIVRGIVSPDEIRSIVNARDWSDLIQKWQLIGGGRGALHLKESPRTMGQKRGNEPPTYEFRFPSSNFESDSTINLVKMLDKIWSASMKGYLPHSEANSGFREAEEMLEDLFGQGLYSFWANRMNDLQAPADFEPSYSKSGYEVNGTEYGATTKIPKLNYW